MDCLHGAKLCCLVLIMELRKSTRVLDMMSNKLELGNGLCGHTFLSPVAMPAPNL